MIRPEWLPIVLQGSYSEIYVMERESLRFLHVNHAARKNLQYNASELAQMTPLDLSPDLVPDMLDAALRPLYRGQTKPARLNIRHARKDGTTYPVSFRLFGCLAQTEPVFIGIANDLSAGLRSAAELRMSEELFRAIVSNTPGLVYQFLRTRNGNISFPYLSQACHAVLGIRAARLRDEPALFLEQILPQDRDSYLQTMEASAANMSSWNWEGRIWVKKWRDVKWINLRCTPRALPDGVQWEGMMTNITQSKQEEARIRHARSQLAELSAHIETVKEKERERIAREIHDDLGGNLAAIKMTLALLRRRLPRGATALVDKADYLDALLDRSIESVHRIARDLRPSTLDIGIVAAIEWQAREFEKQVGIPCAFSCRRKEIQLHPDQATALFRIFQEALTNVGKHARASQVVVKLTQAGGCVKLIITDNGCGIADVDRMKPKAFGIRGMIERASALGGELAVTTAERAGTEVALRIPLFTPTSKALRKTVL